MVRCGNPLAKSWVKLKVDKNMVCKPLLTGGTLTPARFI
jgi:hypothetical protein